MKPSIICCLRKWTPSLLALNSYQSIFSAGVMLRRSSFARWSFSLVTRWFVTMFLIAIWWFYCITPPQPSPNGEGVIPASSHPSPRRTVTAAIDQQAPFPNGKGGGIGSIPRSLNRDHPEIRAFLKSCQTTFICLLFCASNSSHCSSIHREGMTRTGNNLAIFAGLAVHPSRISIKFADFKKAVTLKSKSYVHKKNNAILI